MIKKPHPFEICCWTGMTVCKKKETNETSVNRNDTCAISASITL